MSKTKFKEGMIFGLGATAVMLLIFGALFGVSMATNTDTEHDEGEMHEHMEECMEMMSSMHGESGMMQGMGMMSGDMMQGMMGNFPTEKPEGWTEDMWNTHKSHHPDTYK